MNVVDLQLWNTVGFPKARAGFQASVFLGGIKPPVAAHSDLRPLCIDALLSVISES
jgi:hypothetical protein